MKKKNTWRILGLVACLLFGLVAVSCHKEEEITEEQARIVMANAEVVMDNVSQIYEASETVEEMAQHLDEIKAMPNVEDAYRDDIAICVKIKDGGIIMWCYYQEEEDEKNVNAEELFRNISNTMSFDKGGSMCEEKRICLLDAKNSWEGEYYENEVNKIKNELDWKSFIRKGKEVTPDTILKYLPVCGVTILQTHGCYSKDGQHWLMTGQLYKEIENLPELESWRKDLKRIVLPTKEERKEDAKIMISETFLDLFITKKFPQNSIVFFAACHTLNGSNSLWQKLKNKGLGCMLGFNNSVWNVSDLNCCLKFFNEMLAGATASDACATVRRNVSISGPDGPVDLLCYPENSDITLVEPGSGPSSDDWVDLGLPSGLLWATRNVGATSPEDYGDYFAWGEIQTKEVYDWSTYIYCNGDYDQLTKYCNHSDYGYNGFTDNLTILQPGDDAATANYGGRTPTKEEWKELINNTTATVTTQNGVNGRRFTGPNGNSLFLPAAGYRWDRTLRYAGSKGAYWMSSLYTGRPNDAWYFGFYSDWSGYRVVDYRSRDYGQSVRAVRSPR